MTTRSSLKQPHTVDYTKLEPLPDPPRSLTFMLVVGISRE